MTLAEINRTKEENIIPHLSRINGIEMREVLKDNNSHSIIIVFEVKEK